ncbi:MAG: hypothetical protein NVSMB38_40340 [Ktedonobacteraceae bacterium]
MERKTWNFQGEELVFQVLSYQSGGGTAVAALYKDTEGFASYATISVNMPGAPTLPTDQFYLKAWSENEQIARAMLDKGLIKMVEPPVIARSGFVSAKACQFTPEGMQYVAGTASDLAYFFSVEKEKE